MPQKDGQERGLKLRGQGRKGRNAPFGKSWFFGIAINQYQEFSTLNNAVRDVENIRDMLIDKYDVEPDGVIILTNEKASREQIIDQLDQLVEEVKKEDKLIIFYSGHGHLDEKTERGYWIPFDARRGRTANYIRNSTIRDYIKDIKSLHTLLISDSCFSGSLFVRGASRSTAPLDELDSIPSRWAVCSGRHDEEVYDGEPGQNSPFAESILDALSRNQKKAFNVAKLADQVVEQTRANYSQLPEGNPLYGVGHKGGQYVFRLRADEPEDWAACKTEGTLAAYRLFLGKYPDGQFAAEASGNIAFLEEEEAWEKAGAANTVLAYFDYDRKYPQGRYRRQSIDAKRNLEEVEVWKEALQRNKLSYFQEYLLNYPKGKHRSEAEAKIQAIIAAQQEPQLRQQSREREAVEDQKAKREQAKREKEKTQRLEKQRQERIKQEGQAWDKAEKAGSIFAFKAYLQKYSKGEHAREATKELAALQKAKREKRMARIKKHARWAAPLLLLPFVVWGLFQLVGPTEKSPVSEVLEVYQGTNGKFGFQNDRGEIIIPPEFEEVRMFSEELAAVKNNERWGFINERGEVHIPFRYAFAGDFREGLAKYFDGDKWGYIDQRGYEVIPSKFDEAMDFDMGMALVRQGDSEFFIGKGGNCVKNCPTGQEEPDPQVEDQTAWIAALDAGGIKDFREYQQQFPNGQYYDQAQQEIESIEEAQQAMKEARNDEQAWQLAANQNTISAYKAYQEKYPKGNNYKEAGRRIENLEEDQKRAQEEQDWKNAQSQHTIAAYEAYRRKYPGGENNATAQENINKLEEDQRKERAAKQEEEEENAWTIANRENTIAAYEQYQKDYPDGKHYSEAKSKIDGFGKQTRIISTVRVTLDGKTYKTTYLDGKIWLAENLDYQVSDSWCYDYKNSNCTTYGRLYTWAAAWEACSKLGRGWRLPTDAEWKALANNFGGYYDGSTLKNVGDPRKAYTALIKNESSGFNALLGGWRNSNGDYGTLGGSGTYWSGTKSGFTHVWYYVLADGRLSRYHFFGSDGRSCRCVKN